MHGYLQTVTAATALPLSIKEAQAHLRVTCDDEIGVLRDYLDAVRDWLSREVPGGITLLTTTFDWVLPGFHASKLVLPYPPHQSVTSITYYDENDSSQTLTDVTDYRVHLPTNQPGYVIPSPGNTWPSTKYDRDDALTIRYVAGYTTSTLPSQAKQAARLALGGFNEYRESMTDGKVSELPIGVDRLMRSLDWGYYG